MTALSEAPNAVAFKSTLVVPPALVARASRFPAAKFSVAEAVELPEALLIVALVAAAEMSTSTAMEPVAPRFAWSICKSVIVGTDAASVTKSRLPSSNFRPWKVVVWAMRLMASSEESICNWLAAI